jgi:hypothetical protein
VNEAGSLLIPNASRHATRNKALVVLVALTVAVLGAVHLRRKKED